MPPPSLPCGARNTATTAQTQRIKFISGRNTPDTHPQPFAASAYELGRPALRGAPRPSLLRMAIRANLLI